MQEQISEADLIFPLIKYKPALFSPIFSFFVSVWLLGMPIFVMTAGVGKHLLSLYPSDWGLVITVEIGGVLALLFQGWFLLWVIRQRLVPQRTLRISREGIFFTTLIQWSEIKAVGSYTMPGNGFVLGIALWNYEDFLTRLIAEQSPGPLKYLSMCLDAWALRKNPAFLAQVNISQRILPISIAELMSTLHTHFAAELQRYDISVLERQD